MFEKKSRMKINWIACDYEEKWLKNGLWRQRDFKRNKKSNVFTYQCIQQLCDYKIRKIVDQNGNIAFYQSQPNNHSCTLSKDKIVKKKVNDEICKAYEIGDSQPRQLKKTLEHRNMDVSIGKIYNRLAYLRKCDGTVNKDVYINDIKQFLLNMKDNDDNILYHLNENKFYLLLTTKTTIKKVSMAKNYHIDGTYKIMDPDFPLVVFGCSDANRAFHPIFLSFVFEETYELLNDVFDKFIDFCLLEKVCFNLQTLTADLAPQFDSLMKKKFRDGTRLHCWFHVKGAIQKDAATTKNYSNMILHDIDIIQRAPTEEIFLIMYKKLYEKYQQIKQCATFFTNFERLRINRNKNWYEGSFRHAPSTNSPIESFNGSFKRFHLNGLVVKPYVMIEKVFSMYDQYSKLIFAEKPMYARNNMVDKDFIMGNIENLSDQPYKTYYFFNTTEQLEKLDFINLFKISVEFFDDSAKFLNENICVYLSETSSTFRDVFCTCYVFLKEKQCFHVYNVLKKENLLNYINVPLVPKRGIGRPKKENNNTNYSYFVKKG